MKEQRIREELTQIRERMADLFQGGLANAPESILKGLRQDSAHAAQFGLELLAERLSKLADLMEKRRHEVNASRDTELCDLFCNIFAYLEEGIKQSSFDEAEIRISQKEWERESTPS